MQRSGPAAAAKGARKGRKPLLRRIRRLVLKALGLKRSRPRSAPRTADDRAFAWLMPYLILSTNRKHPARYEHRDALILQMGRVASMSIYHAMRERGYNAFHTHGISVGRRTGTLQHLADEARAKHPVHPGDPLRSHMAAVAHHELLVWYRQHKRRNGERLRIITLTRDPATWIGSHLILLLHKTLPQVRRWYRLHAGLSADQPVDDIAAMRAFGAELGALIVATRLSRGYEALAELRKIAAERWPGDQGFPRMAFSTIACGNWFEIEIKQTLGIDLLTQPALREQGFARCETDYAEMMVLRFEDLKRLVPVLGEFLGIPDFALPHDNATPEDENRAALRAAFEAGLDSAGGAAVRRELRNTPYGKACGYDALRD